ncbi:MAG: ATP-binding cassette domain-containing protein, partial [Abiotrophia defectiva]
MAEFMRIEDLKVHYPIRSGFLNRVTDYVYAVDGVNLTLEEGKTYGLVGESGSGKSTIGKAIIGLEKITSGKIYYEGEEVSKAARHRRSNYRHNVQMIFQDSLSSFNPKRRITDILG